MYLCYYLYRCYVLMGEVVTMSSLSSQIGLLEALDDGVLQPRRPWTPPADRELLRLREMHPEVRPLFDPSDSLARRRAAREEVFAFLRQWHYMHQPAGAKDPNMTWAFGLYVAGELEAVATLNPPAAGVAAWLYGDDRLWRPQIISITRLCATDAMPFNTESFFVSTIWRLLPHLDHRFSCGVAMSDLAVVDPFGRHHTGQIYAASNAWWAGRSRSGSWRGFLNPESGARISRKCGPRNRERAECPPGWVVEDAAVLNRFLWFVGRNGDAARAALHERVQVAVRTGRYPVWRRPGHLHRSARKAYRMEME